MTERFSLDTAKLRAVKSNSPAGDVELAIEYSDPTINRPTVYAWRLGPTSPKTLALRDRLVRAVLAGKIFSQNAQLLTDVNGKTFVSATMLILSRRMNSELKKLGF